MRLFKIVPAFLVLCSCILPNDNEKVMLQANTLGDEDGHLVIIGGGSRPERVMKRVTELASLHGSGKIVVIPSASSVPLEVGPEQAAELGELTVKEVTWLNITNANVNEDSTLKHFENIGGIFFSGGVQTRLIDILKESKLLDRIWELYREGGVIGGTSAGAAVQSEIMLTGDEIRYSGNDKLRRIEAQNIVTENGFGFLRAAIVDQHFVKRSRQNRLISLVLENPDKIGIGIDEQTAVIRYPDNTLEVIGNNQAVIYDATGADILPVNAETYVFGATGLKLHILTEGKVFDLKTLEVIK